MSNNIVSARNAAIMVSILSSMLFSCEKELLVDAQYPEQTVYLAQAATATVGPGGNGIYSLTPNITNKSFRFTAVPSTNLVTVPLGALRSGVTLDGAFTVGVTINTDTIAKLVAANRLGPGTEQLPATAYTLPASVEVPDGSIGQNFDLGIDFNFLNSNRASKYALAVSISSLTGKTVSSRLSTVLIYIDPVQVLLPVANFASYVFAGTKNANFVNTSGNGVTYSWDFGDSSPVSGDIAPSHTYASAGTYTVTLTTMGVTGAADAAVKTNNVIIP